MYSVQCTVYSVQCTVYCVQGTEYTIFWIFLVFVLGGQTMKKSHKHHRPSIVPNVLYRVQCTVYSVQCTVYSVQCTGYSIHFFFFVIFVRGGLTMKKS